MHLPVFQQAQRGLCGGHTEGIGEAFSVKLHRGRDGGDLVAPVRRGDNVFNDDPGVGRGHDRVRQEPALLIG